MPVTVKGVEEDVLLYTCVRCGRTRFDSSGRYLQQFADRRFFTMGASLVSAGQHAGVVSVSYLSQSLLYSYKIRITVKICIEWYRFESTL